MTDNEIIKGLECCIHSESAEDCLECPYDTKTNELNCIAEMLQGVLGLINRLQSERDNYKQIAENQQSVSMDKEAEIRQLKAEVERLEKELEDKQFRCDSCDRIALTSSEHRLCIKQAKAEAVKEFADKIESYKTGIFIKGEELIILPLCDFEEIKSEMVGEQRKEDEGK